MKSAAADDDDENDNHNDMLVMMMMTTMIISSSLKMTATQVVKTSGNVNNSPPQNYTHKKNHAPGNLLINTLS